MEAVRIGFSYYVRYGYGGRRIATELATQKIYDRNGEVFHPGPINAFLHRAMFTGGMCRGAVRSRRNPEWSRENRGSFPKKALWLKCLPAANKKVSCFSFGGVRSAQSKFI